MTRPSVQSLPEKAEAEARAEKLFDEGEKLRNDPDVFFPYTLPALVDGKNDLDDDGNPKRRPDYRYWIKLKGVKSFAMQMRAQKVSRVRKKGADGKEEMDMDEALFTWSIWEDMIVDGCLPVARSTSYETFKPTPDNYDQISTFVGQQIDLQIYRRDGSNPLEWEVTIAGRQATFHNTDS